MEVKRTKKSSRSHNQSHALALLEDGEKSSEGRVLLAVVFSFGYFVNDYLEKRPQLGTLDRISCVQGMKDLKKKKHVHRPQRRLHFIGERLRSVTT